MLNEYLKTAGDTVFPQTLAKPLLLASNEEFNLYSKSGKEPLKYTKQRSCEKIGFRQISLPCIVEMIWKGKPWLTEMS